MDAYEAMPIEAFGEAMLRGMGWHEGKAVGKNVKGVSTPSKTPLLAHCWTLPKSSSVDSRKYHRQLRMCSAYFGIGSGLTCGAVVYVCTLLWAYHSAGFRLLVPVD